MPGQSRYTPYLRDRVLLCKEAKKKMNKRSFCSLFTFIECSSKNHFFCNKKKRTESLIAAGLVFV